MTDLLDRTVPSIGLKPLRNILYGRIVKAKCLKFRKPAVPNRLRKLDSTPRAERDEHKAGTPVMNDEPVLIEFGQVCDKGISARRT